MDFKMAENGELLVDPKAYGLFTGISGGRVARPRALPIGVRMRNDTCNATSPLEKTQR
jgi:hypothetical protein